MNCPSYQRYENYTHGLPIVDNNSTENKVVVGTRTKCLAYIVGTKSIYWNSERLCTFGKSKNVFQNIWTWSENLQKMCQSLVKNLMPVFKKKKLEGIPPLPKLFNKSTAVLYGLYSYRPYNDIKKCSKLKCGSWFHCQVLDIL